MGLGSTFKIADSNQWENAQIGSDPNPTDRIGASLTVFIYVRKSIRKGIVHPDYLCPGLNCESTPVCLKPYFSCFFNFFAQKPNLYDKLLREYCNPEFCYVPALQFQLVM